MSPEPAPATIFFAIITFGVHKPLSLLYSSPLSPLLLLTLRSYDQCRLCILGHQSQLSHLEYTNHTLLYPTPSSPLLSSTFRSYDQFVRYWIKRNDSEPYSTGKNTGFFHSGKAGYSINYYYITIVCCH